MVYAGKKGGDGRNFFSLTLTYDLMRRGMFLPFFRLSGAFFFK